MLALMHLNFLAVNERSAKEKKVEGATGYQEKMETGDKETMEGQKIERKRKRNDGMNIITRHAHCIYSS